MTVTSTNVKDTEISNINAKKIFLMDAIVEHFVPLFNQNIDQKRKELDQTKKDLKDLVEKAKDALNSTSKLKSIYRREKLKNVLLDEIIYLIKHDVVYGESRKKIRLFIQQIDKMPDAQLLESRAFIEGLTKKVKRIQS